MKKIILMLLALATVVGARAQGGGVEFFDGSLEQALVRAQAENKKIFLDFYTSWCGYCKKMDRDAFPDAKVGGYFNQKFVSLKIDAESPDGKILASRLEVTGYPTLTILSALGEELASVAGGMSAIQLLEWAQGAMGDLVTFEQRYQMLKTERSDELVRSLLLGAPEFLARQQGTTQERWILRVERLWADYKRQKPIAEMMNPEDFQVLTSYHAQTQKDDQVFEYIVANYPAVVESVGADKVNLYLYSLNTELIGQLASKGDMDYVKALDRVKGDLKPAYDALMKSEKMEPYTCLKYLNDAIYMIYSRKNVEQYIALTDEYLTTLGDSAVAGDYSSATRTLYDALEGKLSADATRKAIEWIGKALQSGKLDIGDQMELLVMNGDCYKMLNDNSSAKKCYNQAYVVSLQFQNPAISRQIKAMVDNLE